MIKTYKDLYKLLDYKQRKSLLYIQVLIILMSFAEIIGIASIAPFMAVVANPSIEAQSGFVAEIYSKFSFEDSSEFLFYSGLTVLLLLAISSLLSMFTVWRLAVFSATIGTDLADRLYHCYINQNWLFHSSHSSAQLTKQISVESIRVTGGIIHPLMQLNAKIVLTAFIVIGVFIYQPVIAIAAMIIFASSYLLLFVFVKKVLQKNGEIISEVSTERFKLMNEGFGGIKDVILLGKKAYLPSDLIMLVNLLQLPREQMIL
ncbi:membrane hypothetical protein [uncultured Thiomicrorhabdus sp.]